MLAIDIMTHSWNVRWAEVTARGQARRTHMPSSCTDCRAFYLITYQSCCRCHRPAGGNWTRNHPPTIRPSGTKARTGWGGRCILHAPDICFASGLLHVALLWWRNPCLSPANEKQALGEWLWYRPLWRSCPCIIICCGQICDSDVCRFRCCRCWWDGQRRRWRHRTGWKYINDSNVPSPCRPCCRVCAIVRRIMHRAAPRSKEWDFF